MKKYDPKTTIEQGGDPKVEHAYMKFPRENLSDITKESDEFSVMDDRELIKRNLLEKGQKKYSHLHTHPYKEGEVLIASPSKEDLKGFYIDSRRKSMIIAQRDEKTGEVQGYTFIVRGEKGPPDLTKSPNAPINYKKGFFSNLKKSYRQERKRREEEWKKELSDADKDIEYHKNRFNEYENKISKDASNFYPEIRKLAEEENWKLRFVPSKGYALSKETGSFEKTRGLEKTVLALFTGIIGGLLMIFNPRITGNIIIEKIQPSDSSIFIFSSLIFSVIIYFIIRKH